MPIVKGLGSISLARSCFRSDSASNNVSMLSIPAAIQRFSARKGHVCPNLSQINRRFMEQTKADGRETHNRLWVAGALQALGHAVDPSDARVDEAVEAYFEPFVRSCQLIPGTYDMLASLAGRYRLGWFRTSPILQRSNKSWPVWA